MKSSNNTCYICLNEKPYDGSVFVTQIADWLKLYNEKGLPFYYYQLIARRNYFDRLWRSVQIEQIEKCIPLYRKSIISFPSRGILAAINAWNIYNNIKAEVENYDRIVIFSRALNGHEIPYLKKLLSKSVKFVYDARGCSFEEHDYYFKKKGLADKKHSKILSHIKNVESTTVHNVDRIFAVSEMLIEYLSKKYDVPLNKFVLYPCLADERKFYYDVRVREQLRLEMGFNDNQKVYLYAGGLKNSYHIASETLSFMNKVAEIDDNARFLLLSKDNLSENDVMGLYPYLQGKMVLKSIPNDEMYKYLNAADYGLLFRENVPMNNVASPSKFAEHVLCGLPTIISDGIGDYSNLCEKERLGIKIKGFVLTELDIARIKKESFDRLAIAKYGKEYLSKQSKVNTIIEEFKSI